MVTTNQAKGILAAVAMLAGLAMAALVVHMESDPRALTTKQNVTNVTLPVKPIETVAQAEPREITLDPVVITGDLHPSAGPGAAMVKAKAKPSCGSADSCDPKACKLSYRVIGYNDDKFESFRGVYECVPKK